MVRIESRQPAIVKQKKQKECNIREYNQGIGSFIGEDTPNYVTMEFPGALNRLRPDSIVLDVGCGRGDVLLSLSCLKVGLDISRVNLESARQKDPSINAVLGDAENLPFKSEMFDAVTMIGLVHHIPNHRRLFHEACRVLRSDAQLLILDNNADGQLVIYPLPQLAMLVAHLRGHYTEGYGMPLRQGIDILREEGFRVEAVHTCLTAVKSFWNCVISPLLGIKRGTDLGPTPLRFLDNLVDTVDGALERTLHPRFLQRYRLVAVKSPLGVKAHLPIIERMVPKY